ncbi:cell division cycle protein-like protein 23 [Cucurbitaria berberidis CBS 394.84]|uniref:Cell division cycle protein-like protein 23 n=1 Tax=Cucurbitaria berberidis CBS 394.84 TaxID=1168544 RepID=A0A9P4LAQ1_9PLEO|nr:cell division cycle protein-like protein 23 [Cucurbitaria berberidis CBS 394.84]KAF1847748.1 cell division cycle protein-like protein 23 [Cucurbitaria berberidis CBS 394.84]
MGTLSPADEAQLKAQLQDAVVASTERCLFHSAKWAAELLNALPSADDNGSDTDVDSPMSDAPQPHTPNFVPKDPTEARLEAREAHKFLLAKTYFDCREFDRCAAVFLPSALPKGPAHAASTPTSKAKQATKGKAKIGTPTKPKFSSDSISGLSQKSLFIALYAKYVAGEKRMNEDSEMILGPQDGGVTMNKELPGVSAVLEEWFRDLPSSGRQPQGWLEYLYGIVLAKGKNEKLAMDYLIKSVHQYTYNWGAWQELQGLLSTIEELNQLVTRLPQNLMTFIFHVTASQELYSVNDQIHTSLSQILSIFPTSAFLKTQRALLHYHNKDFDDAEQIFSDLLISDPHRVDHLDNYSNILYVMGMRPKLAFLAQLATATDKFRPETCCVVGNYYSLKSEHEKAVMYFRRALTLDRTFLSAWTLMGHEFVEMKNTHAAIESYRRAVDVNRKDYRAWYGLGQTYEVLEMHSYALFYHQRAAALRPYDPKLWMAVGQCFGKVGKIMNGIRAYKRALVAGSYYDAGVGSSFGSGEASGLGGGILDPEVLYQIALLYERIHNMNECSAYMELVLAQEEGPDYDEVGPDGAGGVGVTATTSKARLWLARWEYMRGMYQRAMELANELCQDGVEVEDAKALVRDIRARMERDRGDTGN